MHDDALSIEHTVSSVYFIEQVMLYQYLATHVGGQTFETILDQAKVFCCTVWFGFLHKLNKKQ